MRDADHAPVHPDAYGGEPELLAGLPGQQQLAHRGRRDAARRPRGLGRAGNDRLKGPKGTIRPATSSMLCLGGTWDNRGTA
jgi:hypothetical protein